MESAPDDAENLNAAFRAAHTIKGTAGLFGCDAVVSFTHEVETLMEALRSGELHGQRRHFSRPARGPGPDGRR